MSDTLIIVPCFNEQTNVEKVIEEISQHRPDAEIVIVNDGSSDLTSETARQTGRATILDLPVNLGVGGAVQTGFRYAVRTKAQFVAKLDGDGQHPAQTLENLFLPLLEDEADLVIGSRFLCPNDGYQSSFFRRIGIKVLQWLCRLLTGMLITDPTSGFRGYNRKATGFMAKHYPTFDYPEPEEIVLAVRNGLRVVEIPVEMRERESGESTISSSISVYYMFKVTLAMIFIFLRHPEKIEKEQ